LVTAAKAPIGSLGGAWMAAPAEEAATEAAGLEGWQLYFLGRHGVLGDVDPDVVTAAAYIFPPDRVRSQWGLARRKLMPQEAVEIYAGLCHEWGRAQLSGFTEAVRLADLSQRIIDRVDVVGLPLFAGWRALAQPVDDLARCAHSLQLLREHRGACHGVAMVALGMNPLVAILTNEGGADNAGEYGWERPYPTITNQDHQLRARVEDLTDDLVAPPYAALTPGEQTELLDLLHAASSHALE
jgi:hypothetical protein